MRIKFLFIIFLLLYGLSFQSHAAKPKSVTVEGTSIVTAEDNMSIAELQNKAIFEARKDAILKYFGTKISSTETLMVSEDVTVATQSISQTKAEWISDIDCRLSPIREIEPGKLIIECWIKGVAREIGTEYVDFEVETLKNAPNRRFVTPDGSYNDGDDLFVYFKSPVSGYLNIYLLDETNAFCLLPYRNSSDGAYYIEADKEYIFFSPKTDSNHSTEVDEYVLHSGRAVEINTLDFYFSPQKFNKGKMNIDETDKTRPKDATHSDYAKWKTKLLTNNDYITFKTIDIKIYKNED
ncbi:MAG: hypothetical protein J1E63_02220 [Muribaculaceae bacterium]|nr:hypothetical protein [Muribaculaceae bacterium]